MAYDVTLMPGDGIGPEVVEATRRVLEATGIEFNWDYQDLGMVAQERQGTTLPDATIASVQRTKLGLKGPTTTPVGTGFRSVNVGLRQALNLYANLRPAKTYQGVRSTFDNVDLIIVRENLEDLYAGVEFDTGTPEAARVIDAINAESQKKLDKSSAVSIKMITPEDRKSTRLKSSHANTSYAVFCLQKTVVLIGLSPTQRAEIMHDVATKLTPPDMPPRRCQIPYKLHVWHRDTDDHHASHLHRARSL